MKPRDDSLLSRYIDGELRPDESASVERRLAVDPELRAELADLILLKASLDIGLVGSTVGGVPLGETEGASSRSHLRTWIREHRPAVAVAASALLLVTIGAIWSWCRPRTDRGHGPPRDVLAAPAGTVDQASILAQIDELGDPATSLARKQEIYRSWGRLDAEVVEPLVWALAPMEKDPRARVSLFIALPPGKVSDFGALLRQAQAEWPDRSLGPFAVLVAHLRCHAVPETEALFMQVLKAGPGSDLRSFGELLPPIQSAFPGPGAISAEVTALMNDPAEILRAEAALARAAIGERDGIERAKTLLNSRSSDVRLIATTTIARHGLRVDVGELAGRLDDEAPIKDVALKALKQHDIPIPIRTDM